MDVIRAKKYLIVCFLILNVILISSIINEKRAFSNEFTEESVENLYNIMDELDISSSIPLDFTSMTLPSLEASYTKVNRENFKSIYDNYENVRVIDDKWLEIDIYDEEVDSNNIISYANDFIEKNFKDKSYHMRTYYEIDQATSIIYEEVLENTYIENSYIQFILSQDGHIEITILSMNVEKSSNEVSIVSTAEAVSSIIPSLKGKKIEDINLTYKSNSNESEVMSTIFITLFPVYRIELTDDEVIYVNAVKN